MKEVTSPQLVEIVSMSNELPPRVYGLPVDQVLSFKQLMHQRKLHITSKDKMEEFKVRAEGQELKLTISKLGMIKLLSEDGKEIENFLLTADSHIFSLVGDWSIKISSEKTKAESGPGVRKWSCWEITIQFLSQKDHEKAYKLLVNAHAAVANMSSNQPSPQSDDSGGVH